MGQNLFMETTCSQLYVARMARYQIQVQGKLNASWSSWFDDMVLTVTSSDEGPSITILTGTVADQSALHGLLSRIRDLNLPLLLVRCIDTASINL